LVIRSIPDKSSGKSHIEKLIFQMAAPKIAEATFIMASYMNHCTTTVNPPTNPPGACQLWELDGRQFFSSVSCATKGPTLL
ncbi:PLEKHH1 isoform 15, partial [Pongo abelii]